MWKGVIRAQAGKGADVATKLYAGVRSKPFAFHLLHAKDGERVEARIVHPETGETVEPGAVHKGYEVGSGVFVLMEPEELKVAAPKPSRDIEVHAYVPLRNIEAAWLERPYYLGPDGASEHYFALAEALRATARAGIVSFVMRNKRYVAALCEQHGYLALVTLRHQGEVVEAPKLPEAVTRVPDKKELALAEQLISSLEGEFEPNDYHSEYRERLRALIADKAGGKRIAKVRSIHRAPTEKSLAAALKASLAKGRSHAKEEKQSA
jgi:DNA end-binding protein Ku